MLKNEQAGSRVTNATCVREVTEWARGGVVVKALRYKPAGRGFDSRWFVGIFQ